MRDMTAPVDHPGAPLRSTLRALTSLAHAQTEQAWTTPGGFATRASYAAFLTRAFHVHATLGRSAVQLWGEAEDRSTEQARLHCLQADLNCPPLPCAAPGALSLGQAWGVAYVLNGSCLGAASMTRNGTLRQSWPARYMDHGSAFVRSGALRRFFERLNAAPIDPDQAIAGAQRCFAAFTAPETLPDVTETAPGTA